MKETDFIDQNKNKWAHLEAHVRTRRRLRKYDHLGDQFVQLSEDLSYAQTYYPRRSVRIYLNGLAQRMYKNVFNARTKDKTGRIRFWSHELPTALWESRLELTIALLIFLLAAFVGVASSRYEGGFATQILGANYVNMTENNIANGDPMGVYKDMDAMPMFFMIMYNNLRVSAIFFVMGILFGVGTIGLLFRNGVMLGVFQYFFFQRDLGFESMLTIWQHGTIEIASAVVAGGAGLVLGRAIVFPGTLPRSVSLKFGFLKGLKILLGVAPLIVLAAFIESFFTRFDGLPDAVRVISILASLGFIIGYYVVLPIKRGRKTSLLKDVAEDYSESHVEYDLNLDKLKSSAENLSDSMMIIQQKFADFIRLGIIPSLIITSIVLVFLEDDFESYLYFTPLAGVWVNQIGLVMAEVIQRAEMLGLFFQTSVIWILPLLGIMLGWLNVQIIKLVSTFLSNFNYAKPSLKDYAVLSAIHTTMLAPLYLFKGWAIIQILVVIPIIGVSWYIFQTQKSSIIKSIFHSFLAFISLPLRYLGMILLASLFSLLVAFLIQSPTLYVMFELANDFVGFSETSAILIVKFAILFVVFLTLFCGIAFFFLNAILNYRSVVEIKEATQLIKQIKELKTRKF